MYFRGLNNNLNKENLFAYQQQDSYPSRWFSRLFSWFRLRRLKKDFSFISWCCEGKTYKTFFTVILICDRIMKFFKKWFKNFGVKRLWQWLWLYKKIKLPYHTKISIVSRIKKWIFPFLCDSWKDFSNKKLCF